MTPSHLLRRCAATIFACAALSLALGACEGSNAFGPGPDPDPDTTTNSGGNNPADAVRPGVALVWPKQDTTTIAPGDSLFIEAKVTDNVGLDSVVFEAFSLRGNPDLGTQTRVDRFQPKVVALRSATGRLVRDTTLRRFLLPAGADSTNERVFSVVTAIDTMGNRTADTVRITAGGPRVTIVTPVAGAEFIGGTEIPVRIQASDPGSLIRTIRLFTTGRPITFDRTITLPTPVASIDTTIIVPIPADSGNNVLNAEAVSGAEIRAVSVPVPVRINPPAVDQIAPRTTLSANPELRVEPDDSFRVIVSAVDEVRVDSVGVTVLAIRRTAAGDQTLAVYSGRTRAAADTFTFSYAALGLTGLDSATVQLEITGFAVDPARNCGAATALNNPQSQQCTAATPRLAAGGPGRLFTIFVARGSTIGFPNPGDVIADLVADSGRVYLSNFTRNRVEILPIGATTYAAPVRVGSEPWGLGIGRNRDSLYVANSGGTNISVIPLKEPVLAEAQDKRIFIPNERLFGVTFNPATLVVSAVQLNDYSDRPQFLAQASNGLLVYSTKPTSAANEGTVRIYDPRKLRSEIFIGYVDRHTAGQAIAVNADSAFQSGGQVMVCPRRRFGDAADPGFCITGNPLEVSDSLTKLRAQPANAAGGRWDTRLDVGASVLDVGFADTTFVAASGDRNYIAVGEGVREEARIPLFRAGGDSLVLVSDVRDLISNAAERVIGLGLNYDGSLGVARGGLAYYFSNTARLQGVVASSTPAGGVAQHPDNAGYPGGVSRLSFVSGIDEKAPYIDVIDTFNFFRVKRIYTRDAVVGALAVGPRAAADPANVALRIYALTPRGVLSLRVTSADLVP
ncbi:MAG TPA: hypothetical protein VF746_01260 [Longimicrobium sp.]